jgi:hypothetical protein
MLPMAAYVVAYVTLLPEMRGAYVPMCFFWVLARGARDTAKTGHLAKMGQNWTKRLTLSSPPMFFLFFVVKGCWTGTGTTDAE